MFEKAPIDQVVKGRISGYVSQLVSLSVCCTSGKFEKVLVRTGGKRGQTKQETKPDASKTFFPLPAIMESKWWKLKS